MLDAARDACSNALEALQKAGYGVAQVYRVISAGDSGEGCDVALYRNHENELYEAHMGAKGVVLKVVPGW